MAVNQINTARTVALDLYKQDSINNSAMIKRFENTSNNNKLSYKVNISDKASIQAKATYEKETSNAQTGYNQELQSAQQSYSQEIRQAEAIYNQEKQRALSAYNQLRQQAQSKYQSTQKNQNSDSVKSLVI